MQKTILIIGGGFAGINLAKRLGNVPGYSVILCDRNNYNYFTPLIYQVATGFLETSNVSYPFRKLLRRYKNVQFRMGEFIRVDAATRTCYFDNGELTYNYLVFATGAAPNYFGNKNIEQHAIPLKTINDALQMRNWLLQSLEAASRTTDKYLRKKLLTIVVAGAGPTGVEVSGMLAELRKYIFGRDYPELVGDSGNIYLIDGTSTILPQMSPKSRNESYTALKKLGVIVSLNNLVKDYSDEKVYLQNGEVIETKNLIWTAGISAIAYAGIPSESFGRGKRMIVNEFNQVKGMIDVFAIGDTCLLYGDPKFPEGHPQLAQPAIQQGVQLARNFVRMAIGKTLMPFRYANKGTLAIVGRNRAVADLFSSGVHVGGFTALVIWLFVHLMGLLTYRNKIKTLYNWIGSYLTKDQSLRMIVRPSKFFEQKNKNIYE